MHFVLSSQTRDMNSLRNKFPKIKADVCSKVAEFKRQITGTGGGPPPKELELLLSQTKMRLAEKISAEIYDYTAVVGDSDFNVHSDEAFLEEIIEEVVDEEVMEEEGIVLGPDM